MHIIHNYYIAVSKNPTNYGIGHNFLSLFFTNAYSTLVLKRQALKLAFCGVVSLHSVTGCPYQT